MGFGRPGLAWRRVAAVALSAWLAGAAWGQPPKAAGGPDDAVKIGPLAGSVEADATELVARLPRDVQTVLVVRNGSDVMGELAGSPIARTLIDAGGFAKTEASWEALAKKLGWTPQETAEHLFGGLCVFVEMDSGALGGLGGVGGMGGPSPRWGIVSMVGRETADRLRSRLAALPTDIIGGQPVLSVEDGAFAIAVGDREQGLGHGAGRGGDRRHVLLLTPMGVGLMKELVPVLKGEAGAPLRRTAVFPRAAAVIGAGEPVTLMYRVDGAWDDGPPGREKPGREMHAGDGHGQPHGRGPACEPWEEFTLVAARLEGTGFAADVRIESPRLRGVIEHLPMVEGDVFEDVAKGATVALVQADTDAIPSALAVLAPLPTPRLGEDHRGGAGTLMAVVARRKEGAGKNAPLVVTACARGGVPAATAGRGDELMSDIVQFLEAQSGFERPAADFGGFDAGAERLVRLSLNERSLPGRLLGARLATRWSYMPREAGGCWMCAVIAPGETDVDGGGDAMRAQVAALERAMAGAADAKVGAKADSKAGPRTRRLLCEGMIRPGEIVELIQMPVQGPHPITPVLQRLTMLRWSAYATDETAITASIRLAIRPEEKTPEKKTP